MNALNNASILDQPSSKGFASFAFPEAKSSQTGVSVNFIPSPDKKWYVFRTLYGHAQQVADHIIEAGDYAYLPMIWKDQRRDDGLEKPSQTLGASIDVPVYWYPKNLGVKIGCLRIIV